MPTKLILRNNQCPGDIVMLTGAVRDLHRCQPGRFITDVRTPCGELWAHNPFVTRIEDSDREARVVECEYPLINQSCQRPVHFLYGFVEFLATKLNVHIRPTEFRGDVYLDPAGAASAASLLGCDVGEYWLIDAGGKSDFTAKWPDPAKLQALVDYFRGDVTFVQVGSAEHHHPRMRGVIDMVGKTSIRELVDLMHWARGVATPISFPMHLCAAVPTADGSLRPCVVIAGGREPAHWEQYPGHAYLDMVGRLDCCRAGACWRSLTSPPDASPPAPLHRNGEGRLERGAVPDNVCVDVAASGFPRCIDRISARRIIEAVEGFLHREHQVPERNEFRDRASLG